MPILSVPIDETSKYQKWHLESSVYHHNIHWCPALHEWRKFLRADHRDLGNLDWLAILRFLPLCDLETLFSWLTILVVVIINCYRVFVVSFFVSLYFWIDFTCFFLSEEADQVVWYSLTMPWPRQNEILKGRNVHYFHSQLVLAKTSKLKF